ncbi:IS4 family transposase [Bacillus sp. V3B]|uniref:IS4 family transposase n=1 Tax=Bacillus sp. V3B TaxID=2804915 RepID=UPI00210A2988|nr:IS4 family transposase [Bacillus sp. V3B]MCQ6274829.1 IS4 family transposase [Bacillus sp. V3B]
MRHELNMEEEFQLLSEEMTRIFDHNYLDQLARKELFIQRSGKLKPSDFVSLCGFWNHRSGERSLAELCGLLDSKRHISLSSEGLNQRFNDAGVRLLKHLFHELFSKPFLSKSIPTQQNKDINRIRILDSTAFELPCLYSEKYQGYHKSGVKIQLEYELMKGDFLHLEVQHARDSDLTFGPTLIDTIQEKDLIIRDLGYFSLDDLVQIHQQKAYYLTRLKPNIILYEKVEGENHHKLDLEGILEQMEVGEVREVENIYVSQKKKYIPRLILCKLTDEQTEQRLKKKDKKEKKKGCEVFTPLKKTLKIKHFRI